MSNTTNPKEVVLVAAAADVPLKTTATTSVILQKDVVDSLLLSSKSNLVRISDFCCNNRHRRFDYNNNNHIIDDSLSHNDDNDNKYTIGNHKNDDIIIQSQSQSPIINNANNEIESTTTRKTIANSNSNSNSIHVNLQIINDNTIHQWYTKYCSCNNTNNNNDSNNKNSSVNYRHSIVYTNNIQIFIQFQKFAQNIIRTPKNNNVNNWFWISKMQKKQNNSSQQNNIINDIMDESTTSTTSSITITTIPVQIVLIELDTSTTTTTRTFTSNSNSIVPILYISSITAINLGMIIKPFQINNIRSIHDITNSTISTKPPTPSTTFFVLESYDSLRNNTSTNTTTTVLPKAYVNSLSTIQKQQQSRNSTDTLLSTINNTTNNSNVIIMNATAVTLQIIAKPYTSNFFPNYHYDQYSNDDDDDSENDTTNDTTNIQSSNSSNSNTNTNISSSLDTNVNNWIFPLPQTLIQIGTIVMTTKTVKAKTFKFSHTSNNESHQHNYFYYQVKDIRIKQDDIQTIRTVMKNNILKNKKNIRILYQTTSQTRYRLQSPSLYNTIRAPPIIQQEEIIKNVDQMLDENDDDNDETTTTTEHPTTTTATVPKSTSVNNSNIVINNNNNNYVDKILQPPYCISPHPDVYKLCKAFNRQQQVLMLSLNEKTTSTNANENNYTYGNNNNNDNTIDVPRVIHIVGNEKEYHTITAIEQSCQFLGRNCIHVNGLATYAYCTDYFTYKQQIHVQHCQKIKRMQHYEKLKKDNDLQQMLEMKNNRNPSIAHKIDIDNISNNKNYDDKEDDSESDDNDNKNKITKSSTRTGSIQDQIDGLKIVLDEAVYHSPCVIILENFDQEFLILSKHNTNNPTTIHKDVDTIMERFICVINDWYQYQKMQQQTQEQISIVRQQKQQQQYGNNISAVGTGSLVPAVTIVLHTTQTLSQLRKAAATTAVPSSSSTPANNNGNKNISIIGSRVAYHIQRLCTMSSIHCTSTPTVAYIQYLCTIAINDYKRIPLQHPPKQTIVSALLKFCTNLIDRSANEIIPLIQMILYELSLSSTKENGGDGNNNKDTKSHSTDNKGSTEVKHDNRNNDSDNSKSNNDQIDTYESYYLDRMWTTCQRFDDLIKGNITKNKNKNSSASNSNIPTTTWDDVGGLAHVRREIMDAIEIPLKYPQYFLPPPSSSSSISKLTLSSSASSTGILLYGPPGTGKTLVAKAVATECKLPFLSIKGPELLGSYVGESEANVRTVFAQARELARQHGRQDQQQQLLLQRRQEQQRLTKNDDKDTATHPTTMPKTVTAAAAASVLFFDELDSLAPRRGDTASGGNVMDRVVATLFAELDNTTTIDDTNDDDSDDNNEFEFDDDDDDEYCTYSNSNNSNKKKKLQKEIMPIRIFVIGATNRPDLLDPALLRPGRFDRLVYLGLNPNDRGNILLAQLRKLRIIDESKEGVDNDNDNDNDFRQNIVNKILPILPEYVTGADLSTIATNALLRATERVCVKAEKELQAMQKQEEEKRQQQREKQNHNSTESTITLDDVLKGWDEDKLTPIVTLDDLLEAAKDVVPSVSADDIARYERMHEKYRVSPKNNSNVIT